MIPDPMTTLVTDIVAYEQGEMSDDEIITFFAALIRSGLAWTFQGHYGRTARDLIEDGYITPEGIVVELSDPDPTVM